MTSKSKIEFFKKTISDQLRPLINRDYWLLEVPYYENVGDTLIWQGEMDFLKTLSYKCKGMHSMYTFSFPKISSDDILLFQGGGNFGDLWTDHHDFRKSVISQYPNNRCILFPQTVYYENKDNLLKDAEFFGKYDKVTICARDIYSFNILKEYFANEILLVPDMAFCINTEKVLCPFRKATKGLCLFVKRTDKELNSTLIPDGFEYRTDITVSDWKSYCEPQSWQTIWLYRLIRARFRGHSILLDLYARVVYRHYLVRIGIEMLSAYNHIYSTRLHAIILGILLGKEVTIFDNSYGKNSHFYETWLSDCESVNTFIENA